MYQINVLIKAVSEVGQLSQMGQSSREEFTFKLSTLLNKFMKEHGIKNIKDYEATPKFIDTANVLTDDKVESFITELFHH